MSEADSTPDPDTDTDTADQEDDSTTDVDVDVDSADFPPGALVVDREDNDPDPDHAVVLNTPPIRAADWTVYRLETTVAEDNPDYSADDPVVVVAFREYLEEHEHLPDWDDHEGYWSMAELNEQGIRFYAFPASRLESLEGADPESESEPEPEPESELGSDSGLNPDESAEPASEGDPDADREHERGDSDRENDLESVVDHQGDRLEVSKLGEMYQITAAGEIAGNGALRERLETVVNEYERG
jgi:hypothetical protein